MNEVKIIAALIFFVLFIILLSMSCTMIYQGENSTFEQGETIEVFKSEDSQ